MKGKTVYILGAGSSISHTEGKVPGITGIFLEAWKLGLTSDKGIPKPEYYDLNEYLLSKFGQGLEAEIDFEKAFTFIEFEYLKNRDKFGKLYQQMLEIVDFVFIKLLNKVKNYKCTEYHDFLSTLDTNDTVITFNWDVLLDNKLGRIGHIQRLTEIPSSCDDDCYSPPQACQHLYENFINSLKNQSYQFSYHKLAKDGRGFYLKLHGSVDWHYCVNQGCSLYHKVIPTTFPLRESQCRECLEPNRTLIVPPTLHKSFGSFPLILKLWNMALAEINKAERLVIWGYSFPPTDFYAEWLIRHVNYEKLREVIVINKNPGHVRRIKEFFRLDSKNKRGRKEFQTYFNRL